MPTIDSIFKTNESLSTKPVAHGIKGNLPNKRASYGAKRRQMDLNVRTPHDINDDKPCVGP